MIGLEYICNLFNGQYKEVAEELGITKQTVNSWISGRRKISEKHLPRLSELFKIPVEYFQKELTSIDRLELQIIKLKNEIIENNKDKNFKDSNKDKLKEMLITIESLL